MPNATQQVFVTARIEDELLSGFSASLFFRTWQPAATAPNTAAFTEVAMADNGQRGDGAPGDGVFGAAIPAQALNTVVEFYVRAADAEAGAAEYGKRNAVLRPRVRVQDHRHEHDDVAEQDRQHRLRPGHALLHQS